MQVVPAIDHLTSNGAQFVDGQVQQFDAIILATGYRSNVPQWLNVNFPHFIHLPILCFHPFQMCMHGVHSSFAISIESLTEDNLPGTDDSVLLHLCCNFRIKATFSQKMGSQETHHQDHGRGQKQGCMLLVWGEKEFWELSLTQKILQTTSVNSSLQMSLNPTSEFNQSCSSSSSSDS